ncbi:DUF4188 domain-containing protein [Aeromicrobium sp. CF4.19]|uniref:DUF4188 domain-containing protein n=1 Tax=Aeromicrobium sp. CF4.19 TaxID=3373082 RepID=UPI003EE757B2
MATQVQPGRYTARIDGEFVVFLIGMRFNKIWKVHQWLPVFVAMPRMLIELTRDPERGLLASQLLIGWRSITLVQYWRSVDQLERFAKNPDDPHLPAWRRFNRRTGGNGDVGIYHETYLVGPGRHESLYGNMPVTGLAAAGRSEPIGRNSETARARFGSG